MKLDLIKIKKAKNLISEKKIKKNYWTTVFLPLAMYV